MCSRSLHEGGNGPNIQPLESSSAMRSLMTDGRSLVDCILLVADLSGGSPVKTHSEAFLEAIDNVACIWPVRVVGQC